MNTTELAEAIHDEYGFNRAESRRILDTVMETIRSEVKQGHRVHIRNFGIFQRRKYGGQVHCVFDDSKNFFR